MSTEKIRADAIRRAAQAIEDHQIDWGYGAFYSGCGCGWDAKREHEDGFPQHIAGAVLDALGDMLLTGMERGYDWGEPDPESPGPCSYTADDEVFSKLRPRGSAWKRYVSSWQQVTE